MGRRKKKVVPRGVIIFALKGCKSNEAHEKGKEDVAALLGLVLDENVLKRYGDPAKVLPEVALGSYGHDSEGDPGYGFTVYRKDQLRQIDEKLRKQAAEMLALGGRAVPLNEERYITDIRFYAGLPDGIGAVVFQWPDWDVIYEPDFPYLEDFPKEGTPMHDQFTQILGYIRKGYRYYHKRSPEEARDAVEAAIKAGNSEAVQVGRVALIREPPEESEWG